MLLFEHMRSLCLPRLFFTMKCIHNSTPHISIYTRRVGMFRIWDSSKVVTIVAQAKFESKSSYNFSYFFFQYFIFLIRPILSCLAFHCLAPIAIIGIGIGFMKSPSPKWIVAHGGGAVANSIEQPPVVIWSIESKASSPSSRSILNSITSKISLEAICFLLFLIHSCLVTSPPPPFYYYYFTLKFHFFRVPDENPICLPNGKAKSSGPIVNISSDWPYNLLCLLTLIGPLFIYFYPRID